MISKSEAAEPAESVMAKMEEEYLRMKNSLQKDGIGVAEWVNAAGDALVKATFEVANYKNLATEEGLAFLRQRMNKA